MNEKRLLLKAEKIRKEFLYPSRTSLFDALCMDVFAGESVAIMGRSGEGKSTLLQILGTLEEPTEGKVFILGNEVKSHNAPLLRNRHVGFVFQSFHLLEDYTVLHNVLMPAFIGGQTIKKGSQAYERAHALLEKVGLSHRASYATKLLSGGEKQRVALARALCNDPSLLLADEPSGNLDAHTSQTIHELLIEFAKETQKALVLVTHNQELAALCNKTLHLSAGKLSL